MRTFKCVALLLAFASAAASGQTVEDRKAVLDAQIEIARKQKELQDSLRALAGSAAMGMPVVVSVTIGSERMARLQLPNGIVGHFREGEVIRPGMVVSSIAPKQVYVTVSNGKRTAAVQLEFAGPVMPGAPQPALQSVPDALLPPAPVVQVPPIEPMALNAEQARAVAKPGK